MMAAHGVAPLVAQAVSHLPGRDGLALARSTQTLAAAAIAWPPRAQRWNSSRLMIEFWKNIRLVPLSLLEQQRVRDLLTPVAELLGKYRLR